MKNVVTQVGDPLIERGHNSNLTSEGISASSNLSSFNHTPDEVSSTHWETDSSTTVRQFSIDDIVLGSQEPVIDPLLELGDNTASTQLRLSAESITTLPNTFDNPNLTLLSQALLPSELSFSSLLFLGHDLLSAQAPVPDNSVAESEKSQAPVPDNSVAESEKSQAPFTLPPREPGFVPSQGLHCDVLEHLKTPRTYRRLDSYMRPTAFMPKGSDNDFLKRDYFTGNWGGVRRKLYETGFELYGCYGIDMARDVISNISDNPNVKRTPSRDTQFNYTQIYGGDLYSRLINKNWKGGQFHFSVTWPESKYPLYAYRNNLNPTGTGQIHGHFYTDQGVGDPTDLDQGLRLFEMWIQQRYGKQRLSYVRFGNIFPMIQFNRILLSDMFNFWTFTAPCMLGTTYFTGHAPCYPQAPLGLQVYQIINNDSDIAFQIQQGYYGATGRNNRRGINYDLSARNGVEMILEYTYKGGTYSLNPNKNGKPWQVKVGGQYHSGLIFSNNQDINGDPAALTGLPRKELYGNAQIFATTEIMLYREPGSYGQGLTMFAKAGTGFYDDRNVVKRFYSAGVGYEGLFPKRPRDILYAGWGRVDTTDGFVQFQRANSPCRSVPTCRVTGTQDVFEIGYSMELTPWYWVTPMFQYLRSPNTRTDLGDIFTFGVASRLSF